MSFFQELKRFISRGNVIDMAVGIILGASFNRVVDVLVNNILMPPIGILIGGIDFSSFKITLQRATAIKPAVTIDCGVFINAFVNFFIVGVSVFIIIKIVNKLCSKPGVLTKKTCEECKMEVPFDARRCGYCTTVLNHQN